MRVDKYIHCICCWNLLVSYNDVKVKVIMSANMILL